MATDANDAHQAVVQMVFAQSSIMRGLLRHLVEEGYIPPSKAATIVLDAVALDYPQEESTGESYDLGRETLVSLATALLGWPESGRAPVGPRPDQP